MSWRLAARAATRSSSDLDGLVACLERVLAVLTLGIAAVRTLAKHLALKQGDAPEAVYGVTEILAEWRGRSRGRSAAPRPAAVGPGVSCAVAGTSTGFYADVPVPTREGAPAVRALAEPLRTRCLATRPRGASLLA